MFRPGSMMMIGLGKFLLVVFLTEVPPKSAINWMQFAATAQY